MTAPDASDSGVLDRQYRNDANLSARQRIYRFGTSQDPPWHAWVFDHLLAHVPAAGQARVLEVGCGNGALWCENIVRVPPGWRVLLSDRSQGMLDVARERTDGDGRFGLVRADVRSIPLADTAFDAVIANHMLYHVPDRDRDRTLAEIRRVLRPGGVVLAATNGERHMRQVKDLISRFAPLERVWSALGAAFGAFSLETGDAQLRRHFDGVALHRADGTLRVTDASAVIDYVRSIDPARDRMTDDLTAALSQAVERPDCAHRRLPNRHVGRAVHCNVGGAFGVGRN